MAFDGRGAGGGPRKRYAFAALCRSACLGAGLAAVLSSCALPEPPPVRPDAQGRLLLDRRLDDPQLLTFIDRALGRPRQPLADSASAWDTQRLALAAVYFHPDLQLARSQLRLALARARSARARPAPTWSAAIGRGAGAAIASPWVIGAAVEFVLEPGGGRRWRIAQADDLAVAARADLRQAAWQVRSRVVAARLDEDDAAQRADALQRQFDLQSRRVEAVQRRIAAGEAPRGDERRELGERDRYAAALLQAAADRDRARADLAQAIGVPLSALDGVPMAPVVLQENVGIDGTPAEGSLRASALRGRADVQDALARIDAAQDELRAEAARRWPDLRVGPGYQFDLGANKYTAAASIEWPRAVDGPLQEALARRDLASAELLAIQAAAVAHIDRALSAWRSATQARSGLASLQARAVEKERAAQAQFDAGGLDRPGLLAVQIDRIEADAAGAAAAHRQARALAELEDALQAPLQGDGRDWLLPDDLADVAAAHDPHDPHDHHDPR